MFQLAALAPPEGGGGHYPARVSPFGNPRIDACLTAPRGLSQLATSFIASQRQGIHHTPLVACSQMERIETGIRLTNSRRPACSPHGEARHAIQWFLFGFQRACRAAQAARSASNPNLPELVELIGFEPTTSGLQSPRSPS
jgi:hypothetical protein